MTSLQRITSVLSTLKNTSNRMEYWGKSHYAVDEQIRQIEDDMPKYIAEGQTEKVQTPVQTLADALATLGSARAHLHRSTYASDGAGLTWSRWYSNTLDSINLLSDRINQVKLRTINELTCNF